MVTKCYLGRLLGNIKFISGRIHHYVLMRAPKNLGKATCACVFTTPRLQGLLNFWISSHMRQDVFTTQCRCESHDMFVRSPAAGGIHHSVQVSLKLLYGGPKLLFMQFLRLEIWSAIFIVCLSMCYFRSFSYAAGPLKILKNSSLSLDRAIRAIHSNTGNRVAKVRF